MARIRLTKQQQLFLVRCFARFMGVTETVAEFKRVYEADISPGKADYYNPATIAGSGLSAELKAVYDAERKAYLADESTIPTAHRGYRLRLRDREIHELLEQPRKNRPLIDDLLVNQAKEAGGAFTNKQTVNMPAMEALAKFLGASIDDLPEALDVEP